MIVRSIFFVITNLYLVELWTETLVFEVKLVARQLLCLIGSRRRCCRSGFIRDALAECAPRPSPSTLIIITLCRGDIRQRAAHARIRAKGTYWPFFAGQGHPACWSNPMQTTGQVECKWVVKSMRTHLLRRTTKAQPTFPSPPPQEKNASNSALKKNRQCY